MLSKLKTEGLICWLSGEDGLNSAKTAVWADKSGNGNDFTLYNFDFLDNTNGWVDGAVKFAGDKKTYLENSKNLLTSTDFTLTIKFKVDPSVLTEGDYTTGFYNTDLRGMAMDIFGVEVDPGTATEYSLTNVNTISLARSTAAQTMGVYLNGELVNTSPCSSGLFSSYSHNLIGKTHNASDYFTGSIYSITVYNTLLTSDEIKQLYQTLNYKNLFLFKDGEDVKTYSSDQGFTTVASYPPTSDDFISFGMKESMADEGLKNRGLLVSSIPKILYYTDQPNLETKYIPQLYEKGTAIGQMVYKTKDIVFDQSYVINLQKCLITASVGTNSALRFVFSIDSGVTWIAWNGTEWATVEDTGFEVLTNGMTLNTVNNLTEDNLILISTNKKIRVGWYMQRVNATENVSISQIKFLYTTNL